MGELVRRFATRVILLHALAFLLIVALVALAARGIYRDARAQVLEQGASRQELVAGQTSRAISEFFDAFVDNLEFVRRSDNSEAVGQRRRVFMMGGFPRPGEQRRFPNSPQPPGAAGGMGEPRVTKEFRRGEGFPPPPPPGQESPREGPRGQEARVTTGPARGGGSGYATLHVAPLTGNTGATRMVLDMLWRQVEGRATHLFMYVPDTGAINELGRSERGPATAEIVDAFRKDLAQLDGPRVSAARRVGDAQYVVVAEPVSTADHERHILGLAVPLEEISTRFLSDITAAKGLHYAVFDDLGNEAISSDRPSAATTRADASPRADSPSGRTLPMVTPATLEEQGRYRDVSVVSPAVMPNGPATQGATRRTQTFVFPDGLANGAEPLPPVMAVMSDVNLEGTKWKLVMLAPLDDVDSAVNAMFGRTVLWSAFLVAATGGLLISTSARLIRDRVRLERERRLTMQRDLDHARKIQLEWLPHTYPKVPGLEIAAANVPASHVSGDLYNVFPVGNGQIALVIGDVTGHGLSAAMQMSSVQLLVRSALRTTTDPGAAMEQVNATLCLHDFRGQFVTLLIAVLDPATGELSMASAGHPFPVVASQAGVASLPAEPELILGVDAQARYPTQRFHVPRGALLVLYTDGLVEAIGGNDELFSLARAGETLAALPKGSGARDAIDALATSVQAFRNGRPLADDLTLLAARFP